MLFLLPQKRIEILEAKERKQGEEERTNHGKANNECVPYVGSDNTTPQVCYDERHARFQFEKDGGNTVVELAGSTMATFPYGVVLGLGNT